MSLLACLGQSFRDIVWNNIFIRELVCAFCFNFSIDLSIVYILKNDTINMDEGR